MRIRQRTTYDFTKDIVQPFIVTQHTRCLSIHCMELAIHVTKEQISCLIGQLQLAIWEKEVNN